MLTITTPLGEGGNKNDIKRETQVIIPKSDHGFDAVRGTSSRPCRYRGKVKIEFRTDDDALVVFVNVNSAMNDRSYRSIVRSLLGWSFTGLVLRRIRSHRRWGKGEDVPYLKASRVTALVDRVMRRYAPLVQQRSAVNTTTEQRVSVTT